MTDRQPLPPPVHYLPVDPRFEFKVGLRRLGNDLGHGEIDARVFQIDTQWPAYRAAKLAARSERLAKYVCRSSALSAPAQRQVTARLLRQLTEEYPQWFRREDDGGGQRVACGLAGEILHFDADLQLTRAEGAQAVDPPYQDGLDALLCQVQEDLAFVSVYAAGERLTYLHLCHANHWAGEDKLDRGFEAMHGPVPGFERIARQSGRLMDALTTQGPFVRFAWGVATDARLNHHPEPPPGWDAGEWRGRRFDADAPALYLRVERQVTMGLPEVPGFVFTIRTYLRDVQELDGRSRQTLAAALASMDEATAGYKGLEQRGALIEWLRTGATG